jgi:hypothetical protein
MNAVVIRGQKIHLSSFSPAARDLQHRFVIAGKVAITDPVADRYTPSQAEYNLRNGWTQLEATSGPAAPGQSTPGGLPGRPGKGGDVISSVEFTGLVENGGGSQGIVAPTALGGTGVYVKSADGTKTSRTSYMFYGNLEIKVIIIPPSTTDNFTYTTRPIPARSTSTPFSTRSSNLPPPTPKRSILSISTL